MCFARAHERMRSYLLFALVATAFVPLYWAIADDAESQTGPFRISAIRAMPYYPATGAIRETTDLFDPRLALRNIILTSPDGSDPIHRSRIEDWDIKFGTTVTYVSVELTLTNTLRSPNQPTTVLELIANAPETGRQMQMERVDLATLGSKHGSTLHVPFFVYGTGCERLAISVRLLELDKAYDSQTRMIPFSCGE